LKEASNINKVSTIEELQEPRIIVCFIDFCIYFYRV